MNKKNTNKLYKSFPYLYRGRTKPISESSMSWGFQCDDGWFDLIFELSSQIEEYRTKNGIEAEVSTVKQKFGSLSYYIHFDDQTDPYIDNLIDEAMQKSIHVCEICGKDGEMCLKPSKNYLVGIEIHKTLCPEHAEKLGFKKREKSSPL